MEKPKSGTGPSDRLRASKPIPNKTGQALQGIQECDQGLLVLRAEVAEAIPFLFGFAVVAVDGAFEG